MGLANLTVRIGADISRLQKKMFEAERTLRRSGRRLSQLGNELSSTLTVAIGALGISSIKAAGDIEALGLSLQSALEGKLGDAKLAAEAAKVEMELLRKEALKPGLEFEQALKGSVRLQAVGFSAKGARDVLTNFGNALSLAGGRASDLDGVTLALTQIISKGKISAEEINQLAERVPQVRRAISNVFGTSDSEALQKLGVGVEEFVQKTTAELAKLPQAQSGIRNTLENIAQGSKIALAGLGEEIAKAFDLQGAGEKLVGAIESITNSFKNLSEPVKANIVRFGAFLALIGPAIKILGVYKLLKASLFGVVGRFTASIAKNTATLRTNILAQTTGSKVGRVFRGTIKSINAAMKANPIGLVITALEFLAIGFTIAYAKSEKFRGFISGLAATAKEVFEIIKESVKQFAGGFKKITEGNILDGLKDMGKALVKANPTGIAILQGKRLADAYKEGLEKEVAESGIGLVDQYEDALNKSDFNIKSPKPNASQDTTETTRKTVVAVELLDKVTFPLKEIESLTAGLQKPKFLEFEVKPNVFAELSNSFQIIEDKAAVFGNSFDMIGEKIQAVKSTMAQLIQEGFSPTSGAVTTLSEKLQELQGNQDASKASQEALAAAQQQAASAFQAAAQAQITSAKELGQTILAQTAKAVKARIQEAVATQVLKAVSSVPFPLNVAVAAAAGAGISLIFNKALSAIGVPALAEGGLAFAPTLAMVGDNRNARVDPEVIAPLSKLQGFMSNRSNQVTINGEFKARGSEMLLVLDNAQQQRFRSRGN